MIDSGQVTNCKFVYALNVKIILSICVRQDTLQSVNSYIAVYTF